MFGGFPFVEGSYLDEFIGFVLVRLIAPMDNNFVEEVGYFRFVAFIREPFVEVGDDLYGDARAFVHQPVEVVPIKVERLGGRSALCRRQAQFERYVANENVELSMEHVVFLAELRCFEKLGQRGQGGGEDVQGADEERDEQDDYVRFGVVSDKSEVDGSVEYGYHDNRDTHHIVEFVEFSACFVVHPRVESCLLGPFL